MQACHDLSIKPFFRGQTNYIIYIKLMMKIIGQGSFKTGIGHPKKSFGTFSQQSFSKCIESSLKGSQSSLNINQF